MSPRAPKVGLVQPILVRTFLGYRVLDLIFALECQMQALLFLLSIFDVLGTVLSDICVI